MKKTYSKPDILFDSFSISTNVVASCEFQTPLPQVDECGVAYFNWVVFQSELQGCNKIAKSGTWDAMCYHQPTETNNLFTS